MSLYPTKTRLAFLQEVAARAVYSQPHPTHTYLRDSFYADGAKCTAMAYDVSRASWIEQGELVQGMADRIWWQLTAEGLRVKDGIEEKGQP